MRTGRARAIAALVAAIAAAAVIAWLVLSRGLAPPTLQAMKSEAPSASAPKGAGMPSPRAEPTATAAALASPPPLPPEAARRVRVLDQILASRNDNDPRLDTELRKLDEPTKVAFRARYRELAPEKLNERGTIVFLLGRNLATPADYAFLREVLSQPPCLGPSDCTRAPAAGSGEPDHEEGSVELVLAYPELNAVRALLNNPAPATPELQSAWREAAAAARASRSTVVERYAEKLPR